MSGTTGSRVLVPVGYSVTLRNTVSYVVRTITEGEGDPGPAAVHFVVPTHWQDRRLDADAAAEAEELLDRIRSWVQEDVGVDSADDLPFELGTELIATDQYLFSYRDYADAVVGYARENDLDHIVLDPEFNPAGREPLLNPILEEFDRMEGITYEHAPVSRPVRGRRLLPRTPDLVTLLATFLGSFLFYQLIGGFAGPLDYATGAISAGIVAVVLSGITFNRDFEVGPALVRTGRWLLYLPFLFWEITKANLQVAYIVLHPSLPIDPSIERIRPAVPVGLPVTTLANSITLTPGTVTVDIRDQEFHVHALSQSARDGLYDGALERAVRFIFLGRPGMRIPSLRERGQAAESASDGDPVSNGTDTTGRGQVAGPDPDAADESGTRSEQETDLDPGTGGEAGDEHGNRDEDGFSEGERE